MLIAMTNDLVQIDRLVSEAESRAKKRGGERQGLLDRAGECNRQSAELQDELDDARSYWQTLNEELQTAMKSKGRLEAAQPVGSRDWARVGPGASSGRSCSQARSIPSMPSSSSSGWRRTISS